MEPGIRLTVVPMLMHGAFFQPFWLSMYLSMRRDLPGWASLPIAALGIAAIAATLLAPGFWIATRVSSGRMFRGTVAAFLGFILLFPISILGLYLSASIAFVGMETPSGLGQGEGLFLMMFCLAGVIACPVFGLIAAGAGKLIDLAAAPTREPPTERNAP